LKRVDIDEINQLNEVICNYEEELSKVTELSIRIPELKEYPEELFPQLKNITTFLSSSYNLEKFPDGLCDLENLKKLYIFSNKIESVPEDIKKLTNLIEVTFSCYLKTIPKSIKYLINLKYLSVFYINSLPKEIGYLENLTELSVLGGSSPTLPKEIGNLINLEILIVQTYKLKEIPKEIGKLKKLKKLNLICNEIQVIPKEICELKNLEILELLDNKIQAIPKEISGLSSLEILNLNKNELKYLPEEIKYLKNLKVLKLSDNDNLIDIPKSVDELESLKFLIIDEKFRTEEILKKDFDSEVDFCNNYDLDTCYYPKEFYKNIKVLNLSYHHLEYLPYDIVNMRNLREIDLHHNNLTYLTPLISHLNHVRRLYLHKNKFSFLSEKIFKMRKLKEIVVEGYLIPTFILKDFSTKIRYLYISKDYIIFLLLKSKHRTPLSTKEITILHFNSSHKIYRISLINKTIIPYKKSENTKSKYLF